MQLFDNDFASLVYQDTQKLRQARHEKDLRYPGRGYYRHINPPGPVTEGVDGTTYGNYRKGLDSACVDVVITTTNDKGIHRVVASKRGPGKCFANTFWMHGGALYAYSGMPDFAARRAEKECLVKPELQALLGIARTCAADFPASTFQLCYVAFAPYEALKAAAPDADHESVALLSLSDIDELVVTDSLHPYPALMFREALLSMP